VRRAVGRSPAARLAALAGAVFVEESGWELPASFGDDAAERDAIRHAVAIADVTARAKVEVRGRLDRALPGDALVARIARDWTVVLGGPGEETRLLAAAERAAAAGAMVTDATHLFAGFALAGPRLSDLLARTSSWDPATLSPGEAAGAPIVEIPSLMLRRDLAVPMLEAYVATESGRYAWETLAGVVTALGGGPVGWQALRAEGWS
jgi:glycine cleavage system aminomethyltransferase T